MTPTDVMFLILAGCVFAGLFNHLFWWMRRDWRKTIDELEYTRQFKR